MRKYPFWHPMSGARGGAIFVNRAAEWSGLDELFIHPEGCSMQKQTKYTRSDKVEELQTERDLLQGACNSYHEENKILREQLEANAEHIQELLDVNRENVELKARVKELETELALSQPMFSRRQLEAQLQAADGMAKALETAKLHISGLYADEVDNEIDLAIANFKRITGEK